MKRTIVLIGIAVVLLSCQKEQLNEEISTDLASNKTLDVVNTEKYFGVFASYDMDFHGEIRIHQEVKGIYLATVSLLSGQVFDFKGTKNSLSSSVLFQGKKGTFSLDLSKNSDLSTNTFSVDDKDGYIKVYKETSAGGGILFGDYSDDIDPTFFGFWDAITFGIPEPASGAPIIEDIIITHKGVTFFSDETMGVFEPFMDFCLYGAPLLTGVSDGLAVSGVDQIATFAGKPCSWSMVGLPGLNFDPFDPGCSLLPPGVDGVWDYDGRTGTITRDAGPSPTL